MRLLVGAANVVAAIFLCALPAAACSCTVSGIGGNPCKPPTADVIVRAVVVSKQPSGITLKVAERFQAAPGNTAEGTIILQSDLTDCAYPFEVGQEYLVFANKLRGQLTTTICTATQPVKTAAAVMEQLRAKRDGTALPDLFGFVKGSGHGESAPFPNLAVTARSEQGEFHTQTAIDGTYEFQSVPAGRYQMSIEPPAGRTALWEGGKADSIGTNAGLGDACPINFEIIYDGRISGTIAARDGQPISGIVYASYLGPEKINTGRIIGHIKEGRFELDRLWPGQYRLVFQRDSQGGTLPPAIYYPGTPTVDTATPVELEDGTHRDDLRFVVY